MSRHEWTYPATELTDEQADALTVERLVAELDVMLYIASEDEARRAQGRSCKTCGGALKRGYFHDHAGRRAKRGAA